MHLTREVAPGIHWIGGNDRRIALFENMFPLPNGVVYNSYLVMDQKVALIDAVDSAITRQFFENIDHVLGGRAVDYLVVNHMEPDHCGSIEELSRRFPFMKIVGNVKTFQMIRQFYDFDTDGRTIEVTEGDGLNLGAHRLRFFLAPMVHWPEVMFTYEETEKILFSADAFGAFGALHGNLFADETDFDNLFLDETRRYYANIIGKYGPQVRAALQKISGVAVEKIFPLHGPLWRRDLDRILGLYDLWSRYEPEKRGVLVAYASMYGNTENAALAVANRLAEAGVRDMRVYDISKTHASRIIADAFKYSHLVLASPHLQHGAVLRHGVADPGHGGAQPAQPENCTHRQRLLGERVAGGHAEAHRGDEEHGTARAAAGASLGAEIRPDGRTGSACGRGGPLRAAGTSRVKPSEYLTDWNGWGRGTVCASKSG